MDNIQEMLDAFDAIQMPRPKYVLENMVVHSEDTEASAYAHCVLEMQIAYDNLRIAKHQVAIKELEIKELEAKSDEKSLLEAEIKKIELEQTNRARIGAAREFEVLYGLWQSFSKKYTREELDADQQEYWARRLTRQANQDLLASGRVSQSNLDALRMIGKSTIPQLDVVRDVERRYLDQGKSRILIAVPTEKKATSLPCLDGVTLPSSSEIKILNVYERSIPDAYDYAVQTAIEDNADWLVTVEDDTFPQQDAIIRLLQQARNNGGQAAVGAWYPKREHPRQGVHIIIGKNGEREFLGDDGQTWEVQTLAMGCTIYPVSMFLKIPRPWFATTSHLSQDSFISQLAREHGYKLLVDTSIKCKHVDRNTREVFE